MTTPLRSNDEGDTGFLIELDQFSGPLDLLLTLIREQQIEITDIPIARITDQFLRSIEVLGLDQAADYLEMAALLLRIKIQMLLPRPIDDEAWDDPRAELVRRLLEYEQIKEVADWLRDKAEYRADRFARGWFPPDPELPPAPLIIDLDSVVRAVQEVIDSMPEPIIHRILARPLDIEGARERILHMLRTTQRLDFRTLVGERPTVADVVSVLLVLLELARMGTVRLAQQQAFEDFEIRSETANESD
ncbi:MAG: segregation and condensation protein A [Gemmatimonadales bacterium]